MRRSPRAGVHGTVLVRGAEDASAADRLGPLHRRRARGRAGGGLSATLRRGGQGPETRAGVAQGAVIRCSLLRPGWVHAVGPGERGLATRRVDPRRASRPREGHRRRRHAHPRTLARAEAAARRTAGWHRRWARRRIGRVGMGGSSLSTLTRRRRRGCDCVCARGEGVEDGGTYGGSTTWWRDVRAGGGEKQAREGRA